jgi:hypothetical protein
MALPLSHRPLLYGNIKGVPCFITPLYTDPFSRIPISSVSSLVGFSLSRSMLHISLKLPLTYRPRTLFAYSQKWNHSVDIASLCKYATAAGRKFLSLPGTPQHHHAPEIKPEKNKRKGSDKRLWLAGPRYEYCTPLWQGSWHD